MNLGTRIMALLAGAWTLLASLLNTYFVSWGFTASDRYGDFTDPALTVMWAAASSVGIAALAYALTTWAPCLGVACGAAGLVLLVMWIFCLGSLDILYALIVTLLTFPGIGGLGALWLEAKAEPPVDRGPPRWLT